MRLDLVLPNEGGFALESLESGPHFEAMGWDGLWVTDHIVGLEAYRRYGADWIDATVAMAHLAARTKRIRIGCGVIVLPYRDPVILARTVASLDVLSGGRIDLGVGTGWAEGEFQAVGRGDIFEARGAFADEVLEVMLACWKEGGVAFQGKWFDLKDFNFDRGPVQPGKRVPIWVGARGLATAPMRRAARFADVWHPTGLTPEEMREGGERLDEIAGRKVARSLRVRCDGDPSQVADMLRRYQEVGCVEIACAFDVPQTFAEYDKAVTGAYEATKGLQG